MHDLAHGNLEHQQSNQSTLSCVLAFPMVINATGHRTYLALQNLLYASGVPKERVEHGESHDGNCEILQAVGCQPASLSQLHGGTTKTKLEQWPSKPGQPRNALAFL